MADLLTTLHPINDEHTDLYPNIKRNNLPQEVKDELDAIPNKVDKVQGKGLSTNDFTNADKLLVDTIPDKVDKVQGKGLSTNDFTDADKLALETTIPNALEDKVSKVQGKGLSTNDFTNADKLALETTIPEQIQLVKDNIDSLGTAVSGKVDKVSGKGLSTNDYTNADKLLVDTIPDKVDKVQGKGLSTNDFTNADKSYLDNLPNFFISIASGGVVDLTNPPASSSTSYFGAKNGTTSFFRLSDSQVQTKVTGNTGEVWSFIMNGNSNSVPMFTHITPASGNDPAQIRQYKLPKDLDAGVYHLLVSTDQSFSHAVNEENSKCEFYQYPNTFGVTFSNDADALYMNAEIPNNSSYDSDLNDDYVIPLFLDLGIEITSNPNVETATIKATAINDGGSYFSYMILDFRIVLTSNNVNSLDLDLTFNKDIFKYYTQINDAEIHTRIGWVYCDATSDNEMTLEWVRENGSTGTVISGTRIINVGER